MIDGLVIFNVCNMASLIVIDAETDSGAYSRCGQYRIVCALSPNAPQILHLYLRRRGQHTRFRLSFTLCDVYTCSSSPLFLQNTQNYKRKKKNENKQPNGMS